MSTDFTTKMTTISPDGKVTPNVTFSNPDRDGVNKLINTFVDIYVKKDGAKVTVNELNRVEFELPDARIVFEVTPPPVTA